MLSSEKHNDLYRKCDLNLNHLIIMKEQDETAFKDRKVILCKCCNRNELRVLGEGRLLALEMFLRMNY